MQKMKLISSMMLVAFVCVSANPLFAGDAPMVDGDVQKAITSMAKQMEEMRKLIQDQNAKIQYLEQKTRDGVKVSAEPSGSKEAPKKLSQEEFKEMLGKEIKEAKYFKNLKMGGDFRLRWEAFDQGENTSTTESRNRFRYRLRYGVENDVGDDMKVGFRIVTAGLNNTTASGGTVYAGDPTSTNQTIGSPGLFSYSTIALDKAYAKYTPKKMQGYELGPVKVGKFEIGGGKFDNPHLKYSSPMIWDGDVMPEGLYERLDISLYETETAKVNMFNIAMQSPLIESGTGDRDASMYSFQTGLEIDGYTPLMEKPIGFTSAFGTYLYRNLAEDSNFTLGSGASALGTSRGMTGCVGTVGSAGSACQGLEGGDPRIISVYNELKLTPVGNTPIKLFSDVASNVNNGSVSGASARKNTAWGFGLSVGELKAPKDWQLSYGYYQIPPNAVVSIFNDSDFGQGHNNNRGSVVKAGYQLSKALQLNFAWFNVTPYDTTLSGLRDQATNRFQSDLVWKF